MQKEKKNLVLKLYGTYTTKNLLVFQILMKNEQSNTIKIKYFRKNN